MIVRNESAVIARCIRSVKHLLTHWAIVDTGSTDDTIEIIRRELADLPGEIISREWQNFEVGRNLALDFARLFNTDYILTLDADEVLHWPSGWDLPELT